MDSRERNRVHLFESGVVFVLWQNEVFVTGCGRAKLVWLVVGDLGVHSLHSIFVCRIVVGQNLCVS